MTDLSNPTRASVFIAGINPATAFATERVGDHERMMRALFNRDDETCRGLYAELEPRCSLTRHNLNHLSSKLKQRGIREILETDVVCYSTPKANCLDESEHADGLRRGQEIFRNLIEMIRPRVVIIHGNEACDRLSAELPKATDLRAKLAPIGRVTSYQADLSGRIVDFFWIPSMSRSRYDSWLKKAPDKLDALLDNVARILGNHQGG